MKKLNFARLFSLFVVLFLVAGSCNNEKNDIILPEAIKPKEEIKEIKEGETFKFEYDVRPTNAKGYSVSFSSSNENIATVDKKDGKVTGLNVGNASITASLDGRAVVRASVNVTVTKGNFPIESLSYDGLSQPYQIHIGEPKQLTPTIVPEKASANVEYSSSNNEIAVVNTLGSVVGKSIGKCTITAIAKENRDITASIEVEILPKKVAITGISAPINIQSLFDTGAIKIDESGVKPIPNNAYPYKFKYELADNSLAQIDQETSELTPLKSGETILTIKDETTNIPREKKINLVIVKPIVKLDDAVITTIEQGKTVNINYQTTPEDAYGYLLNLSYYNDNDKDKITLNATSAANRTAVTITAISGVKNPDNSTKYIAPGRFKIKIEDKSSISATSHLYNGTATTEAVISVIPSSDDDFEVVFEDNGASNTLRRKYCGDSRCTLTIGKIKNESQVDLVFDANIGKFRDLGGLEYFKGLQILSASNQNWRDVVNLAYLSPKLKYIDFTGNGTDFTKFYMTQEQVDKLSSNSNPSNDELYLLDQSGTPVLNNDSRIEIIEI